jgi:hypothetical protein
MVRRSETRTMYCDPDARLRVENDAGLVEVTAWEHDHAELVVHRFASRESDLDKLVVEFSGGPSEVLVTYTTRDPVDDAWVDFHVKAPRMAAVDLHNASGEILVSGFHGSSRASTASGSIRAARMSGTSTLTSASGAILGAALEGRVFARSASGHISLHGTLTGDHRVETASGGIEVDGVDGSINARSASGSIDVTGRFRGSCSVRTVSGAIKARLLPGSDVTIRPKGFRPGHDHPRGTGILAIETTSGTVQLDHED